MKQEAIEVTGPEPQLAPKLNAAVERCLRAVTEAVLAARHAERRRRQRNLAILSTTPLLRRCAEICERSDLTFAVASQCRHAARQLEDFIE